MITEKKYHQMNREAANFWYFNLTKGMSAKLGQNYLNNRGIDKNTWFRWGLGYTTNYQDNLVKHMLRKGYSHNEIIEANLGFENKSGKLVDRFKNRIMFPIVDENKNIIGFGGRAIGSNYVAKYLNTAAGPYFDKSSTFFGLNKALDCLNNNLRSREIIICEGYTDILAMHKAGFNNSVATLGTAFTNKHIDKLQKMNIDKVTFMFDGDEAGQGAALKTMKYIDKLYQPNKQGNQIQWCSVCLPDKQDPADFLRNENKFELEKILDNACDLTSICLDMTYKQWHFPSDIQTANTNSVLACLNMIDPIKNTAPSWYKAWVSYIAEKGPIPADVIYKYTQKQNQKRNYYKQGNCVNKSRITSSIQPNKSKSSPTKLQDFEK